MKTSEVLKIVDLKTLKQSFNAAWNKSPRTMVQTMKDIIEAQCNGAKISTGTANALLHKIDA